ncbi:hypothetical protein CHLRE_17g722675v5 [Chlamydomonas reinhardtii]|uniref:Uncharacterized protein n=1 Tax=Chlamydomonas reinhardtii TaxID=3055 RepID=A0A2K3CQF0_CHLRE|nr:uncharacterized protein CHLRE_17g722675v5 [Chlamydomonas reinhardtii]PNW70506.1 hypothetical protein CHLRE_17g722675v5 [Chlamydomonas reinhardtii]
MSSTTSSAASSSAGSTLDVGERTASAPPAAVQKVGPDPYFRVKRASTSRRQQGRRRGQRQRAAVLAAHWTDVFDGPSRLIFRGCVQQYQAVQNALCFTHWTRPAAAAGLVPPNLPDIGKARGAVPSTVDVALAAPSKA